MLEMNDLTFPEQLNGIRDRILAQADTLRSVAEICAGAIAAGGVAHIYANGHSRMAVEQLYVRMAALTGFHPILAASLTSFTDVVGASGLRSLDASTSPRTVRTIGAMVPFSFGNRNPV